MFSDFEYMDYNFNIDISQGVDSPGKCSWFTLPLAVYRKVTTNGEENVYEYLSFPSTAKEDEHFRFFSLSQPYFWNHDYSKDFKGGL